MYCAQIPITLIFVDGELLNRIGKDNEFLMRIKQWVSRGRFKFPWKMASPQDEEGYGRPDGIFKLNYVKV